MSTQDAVSARLTRPHKDSTPGDLRRYLRDLGKALQEAGVDYGDEFTVARARTAYAPLYELQAHDEDQPGAAASSAASARGALANLPRSGTQRDRILRAAVEAEDRGVTSDEMASLLSIPLQSAKPRMLELRVGGWLRLTGGTRRSRAGARVEVMVPTDKAREALGYLQPREPGSVGDRLFEPAAPSALSGAAAS